jgi:hypothetical protein
MRLARTADPSRDRCALLSLPRLTRTVTNIAAVTINPSMIKPKREDKWVVLVKMRVRLSIDSHPAPQCLTANLNQAVLSGTAVRIC